MHIDQNDMIFISIKVHIAQNGMIFESIQMCSNIVANFFRPMICQIQHIQRLQSLQVEKVTNLDRCHEVVFFCYILSLTLGVYWLIFPLVRDTCSSLSSLFSDYYRELCCLDLKNPDLAFSLHLTTLTSFFFDLFSILCTFREKFLFILFLFIYLIIIIIIFFVKTLLIGKLFAGMGCPFQS